MQMKRKSSPDFLDDLEDKRHKDDDDGQEPSSSGESGLQEAASAIRTWRCGTIYSKLRNWISPKANEIITRDTELLDSSDVEAYRERIDQRAAEFQFQYITKVQEFKGLPFCVNENVPYPKARHGGARRTGARYHWWHGFRESDVLICVLLVAQSEFRLQV